MNNKKRILITGGMGFIGSHCIEKWKSLNYEVWIIDNFSSNAIDTTSSLIDNNVNLIISNILDIKWDTLPKFDRILHLASPVGPVGVLKHSGNMGRIILDDIYWAIAGAKHNSCPLIFVSTSEIYGHRNEKSYLQEKDDKVLHGEFTVRNEYAIAKLLSEIVLVNQARMYLDFKFQIIRPFNVTGWYQLPDGGFVLPRFVNQALSGEDITVYYDGSQLRAFTWVKDIVEGIYLTSEAPAHLWNEEWNIGNEKNEQTIQYLAETVVKKTRTNSKITHVDPVEIHGPLFAEAPEKIPNSDKIKNLLGWQPTKYVDDVIDEVIDFYRSRV
jgi:nucleoside-diphosphate-sugar epimerase